jgi:ribosome-binding factor A
MSFRIQKVNSLIREQIGEILTRELNIKPGVFLTIAKVDTTKDLRYTHIFVSVFPEKEGNYIEVALKNEKSGIQRKLNKKLHMKIVPKIIFKLDTTEAEADEIEKILRKIKNQ